MQKPKYQPNTWVVAKQGLGYYAAQIVGATFNEGRGWSYDLAKPGITFQMSVKEEEIVYTFDSENKLWKDVNDDGSGSIRY